MLGYPTNSAAGTALQADIAQLVLCHLMAYTLETISDKDGWTTMDKREMDSTLRDFVRGDRS